jgi:hypothetical protein
VAAVLWLFLLPILMLSGGFKNSGYNEELRTCQAYERLLIFEWDVVCATGMVVFFFGRGNVRIPNPVDARVWCIRSIRILSLRLPRFMRIWMMRPSTSREPKHSNMSRGNIMIRAIRMNHSDVDEFVQVAESDLPSSTRSINQTYSLLLDRSLRYTYSLLLSLSICTHARSCAMKVDLYLRAK